MRKTYALMAALASSMVLMIGTGASAGTAAPARPSTIYDAIQTTPGYAAIPKTGHATAFRYVTATYTVPIISDCAQDGPGVDDEAVGLGGSGHSSRATDVSPGEEAAGTNTSCNADGTVTYEAGYFNGSTDITAFPVSPGDEIFASVDYDSTTKQYTYRVSDENSGKSLDVTQACPSGVSCSTDSAQVTVDDEDSMYMFVAADFQAIKITDSAGQQAGLSDANWNLVAGTGAPDQGGPGPGPIYSATSPAESAFQITQ